MGPTSPSPPPARKACMCFRFTGAAPAHMTWRPHTYESDERKTMRKRT